jgi:hypothetical protein
MTQRTWFRLLVGNLIGVGVNALWNLLITPGFPFFENYAIPRHSNMPETISWIGSSGLVAAILAVIAILLDASYLITAIAAIVYRIAQIPLLIIGIEIFLRKDPICPFTKFDSSCMRSNEMVLLSLFHFVLSVGMAVGCIILLKHHKNENANLGEMPPP